MQKAPALKPSTDKGLRGVGMLETFFMFLYINIHIHMYVYIFL